MKKKFIFSLIGIILVAVFVYRATQRKTVQENAPIQTVQNVTTRSAQDSTRFTYTPSYPAIVVGDQQAALTAETSGTIKYLNFEIGKSVWKGQRLATIDLAGNISQPGEYGLKSGEIRSLELAKESAKEAYRKARDLYKKDDSYANKKDKEIAEINVDSATVALQSALDKQYVTAPISGTVVERFVSLGDSVSVGQKIATISKTCLSKVQFYVSADELPLIKLGDPVTIMLNGDNIPGTVDVISPQADPMTKRFLIEAKPLDGYDLTIGSVASVSFHITRTASASDRIILPLSVITVGQNESYLFVADNGIAKKVSVTVHDVSGETAEISSTSISPDTQIIFDGSKLVHDNEPITLTQQ